MWRKTRRELYWKVIIVLQPVGGRTELLAWMSSGDTWFLIILQTIYTKKIDLIIGFKKKLVHFYDAVKNKTTLNKKRKHSSFKPTDFQ